MTNYNKLAKFYDFIYFDNCDLDFYLEEARNAKGPLLEIACGTGRISLILAKRGYDVTGLDNSSAMLNEFKKKIIENKDISIYKRDMRDFSLGRKFGLIILPYRSFLHLKNDHERLNTLKCIFNHLEKNGKAIIHLYNPTMEDLEMQGHLHFLERENMKTKDGRRYSIEWYQRFYARECAYYKIKLHWKGEVLDFPMVIHFVNPEKMKELIKKAGFTEAKAFSSFGNSGNAESPGEIMWHLMK